jgi:polyisoprenoid-binding protein YceI
MSRFRLLPTVALAIPLAVPLSASAAVESYTIDPFHSFANFTVSHLDLTTIHGRFGKTTGKVTLDKAAKSASLDVQIDAASVDTGDSVRGARARTRDEHLRSADFFNVAEFPSLTYKSTRVAFNGDTPSAVEGNLTIIGVTKPVTLKVEHFKCISQQSGKERCGGYAVASIKRSDFGMKRGIPQVGDDIQLMLGFEGDKD